MDYLLSLLLIPLALAWGHALVLLLLPVGQRLKVCLVKGRRTGSSGHASPSSRTERRAKQPLDPPPNKTASARECGAASPPRAPEPTAASVG